MASKNKQPTISVIVPVYKAEPYFRKCVESILNQTYTDLEIILVDDGSPDNCPVICDEYQRKDDRVKVIHKENGGVSSARNAALEIACGQFISFVDADDWIDVDYFSSLITQDTDVVIAGESTTTGVHHVSEVRENYYTWGGLVGPCEKLYRRDKIHNIRFREDLPVGEDIIFNLEVLKQIEYVFYIPYKGYHITANAESLTRAKLRKYDPRLDEEWQREWGKIHSSALHDAGIMQTSITAHNINGCSVWIYQKIKNYCYADCPHPYEVKIQRINRQLVSNKENISQIKSPTSPKTYHLLKLCLRLKSAHIVYFLFKILVALKQ